MLPLCTFRCRAVVIMSDPEAGGLEGGENPEPEEDANLSIRSNNAGPEDVSTYTHSAVPEDDVSTHSHSAVPEEDVSTYTHSAVPEEDVSTHSHSADPEDVSTHSPCAGAGHVESLQPPLGHGLASGKNCCTHTEAGDSVINQSQQTGTEVLGVKEEICGDLSQPEQIGTGVLSMDEEICGDLSQPEQIGTGVLSMDEENCGDLSQLEQGGAGALCVKEDICGDLGLPEDARGACGQATLSCWSDDLAAPSLQRTDNTEGCEMRHEPVSLVLTGGSATDNSDHEPLSHSFSESRASDNCDHKPESHDFTGGRAKDNPDQEEPPLKDELFTIGVCLDVVQGNGAVDGGQNGVDVGNNCAVLDHTTNSAEIGSVEAFEHTTNSADTSSVQGLDHTTNGADTSSVSSSTSPQVLVCAAGGRAEINSCENESDQSASYLQRFHCSSALTSEIAEKEEDQSPECDREQSLYSSSSHGSQAAPFSKDGASLSPQAYPSQSHQIAQPGGVASLSSSPTHYIKSCEAESVDKQGKGSCDISSECDDTVAMSRSTSAQPPPASRGMLVASGGRSSLLKPSLLNDDLEDEDLLTELDAELHLPCSPSQQDTDLQGVPVRLSLNGLKEVDPQNSELCKQFEEQLLQLQETLLQREREIHR